MTISLNAGVSGLKSFQTQLDVIGNNVANVNTTGYKSSNTTFAESLLQTVQGAMAPQNGQGGTNPVQIGLGVSVAGVYVNHSAGSTETTGVSTNLALDGDGYFIAKSGDQKYYTRAGNFTLDSSGNLVSSTNGFVVQGWKADSNGKVDTNAATSGVHVSMNQTIPANTTTKMNLSGNLNLNATGSQTSSVEVYDSLGSSHTVNLTFAKSTVANNWTWSATDEKGNAVGTGTVVFDANGAVTTGGTATLALTPTNGSAAINVATDLSKLTQYALDDSTVSGTQDGYASGTLNNINVNSAGEIQGVFSNGMSRVLAQVAIANFNNPSGLTSVSGTMFAESSNSGTPVVGTSNNITPGALEASNVDLAEQFTKMITAQRGYQANSRVITTSDEMLQELVNLKR